MDYRQLQALTTLARCDFNVSRTAEKLFVVQSAVSQQLMRLEQELGSALFHRKGKRLIGVTDFGEQVLDQARQSLRAMQNILILAEEQQQIHSGILRIGCTHAQARYVLPPVIHHFNRQYPDIELQIHQGNPRQLVEWAATEQVDFSVCTEELGEAGKLESTPCYRWNRSLITLPDHPLATKSKITLDDLCDYPIITYVLGFTGRRHFNDVFEQAELKPNIILSAADTDIIKAYVLDGMGIGIIASMAYQQQHDQKWVKRDLGHLFPWETTRIAYPKSKTMRSFHRLFIDVFLQNVREEKDGRFQPIP